MTASGPAALDAPLDAIVEDEGSRTGIVLAAMGGALDPAIRQAANIASFRIDFLAFGGNVANIVFLRNKGR